MVTPPGSSVPPSPAETQTVSEASHPEAGQPLHVVLLLGGEGQKFSDKGYLRPKVLVRLRGKPMIYWSLSALVIHPMDVVTILYHTRLDFWNFPSLVRHLLPHLRLNFVPLHFNTRGPVESALVATEHLEPDSLPICFFDGDVVHQEDVLAKARSFYYPASSPSPSPRARDHAIFYKQLENASPEFSFIKLENPDGSDQWKKVTAIAEKEVISKFVNIGIYTFASARSFRYWAKRVLDEAWAARGCYFLSCIYSLVLFHSRNQPDPTSTSDSVYGIEAQEHICINTPTQVQEYLFESERTRSSCSEKLFQGLRVCFDFDNTLVTFPSVPGDDSTIQPIPEVVGTVKRLKAGGATIIVNTCRRGNREQMKIVFDSLDSFGIPYDELYFGKPVADLYVDDLSVNPYVHFFEEMGMADHFKLIGDPTTPNVQIESEGRGVSEFSFMGIQPRSFHRLRIEKNSVIKSGHASEMEGQIFYFKNIPPSLHYLFPRYIKDWSSDGIASLEMTRAKGIPLTYCSIYRTLTLGQFKEVVDSLRAIHAFESEESPVFDANSIVASMYENWGAKLRSRWRSRQEDCYNNFPDSGQVVPRLLHWVEEYQLQNRGVPRPMIHGDAVFTNVLVQADIPRVTWIDMRGRLGSKLSLGGDANYDWAKVLQSLMGYDYLLLGRFDPNEKDDQAFFSRIRDQELLDWFKQQYCSWYGEEAFLWLQLLSASLLIGILPLHTDQPLECQQFYRLALHLFRQVEPELEKRYPHSKITPTV